jgi:hypothetical protein
MLATAYQSTGQGDLSGSFQDPLTATREHTPTITHHTSFADETHELVRISLEDIAQIAQTISLERRQSAMNLLHTHPQRIARHSLPGSGVRGTTW